MQASKAFGRSAGLRRCRIWSMPCEAKSSYFQDSDKTLRYHAGTGNSKDDVLALFGAHGKTPALARCGIFPAQLVTMLPEVGANSSEAVSLVWELLKL